MKNSLMELKDKIMLRKRSVIERVNDELNVAFKKLSFIEHLTFTALKERIVAFFECSDLTRNCPDRLYQDL